MVHIARAKAYVLCLVVLMAHPRFAEATILSGKVNADDAFWAYLSTNDSVEGTLIGSYSGWGTSAVVSGALTPGVTNYLHIKVQDGSPPGGFLGAFSLDDAQFRFANGTSDLVTNTVHWKVSVTGFGADYHAPTFNGFNGVSPWGKRTEMPDEAAWLWNGQGGNPSYFSTAITAVPEPAALSILTLCGLGVLRRRRSPGSTA